jgi:hypothetical protein
MLEKSNQEPIKADFATNKLSFPGNLQTWFELLDTDISKKRALINSDTDILKNIMQQAIDLNVIGIRIPKCYGGLELDLKQQHYYNKAMAKASGALTFLLAQFYATALPLIAQSDNVELREQWLGKALNGNNSFGVSFAHLRNIISPPVTAKEEKTHYIVNGDLRYITGYKIFDMLVLGFVCENEEIFALTPFCKSESFVVQSRLKLVAADSTNTMNCKLINHCIDKNMVISKHPLGTLLKGSNARGRHIVAFQIGLGFAALDLISTSQHLEISVARDTYNHLLHKLSAYDTEMLLLPENISVVPTRIKVMDILNKIFLFGDQIFRGAATIADHPFLLIKQEAQIFTATASTEETLTRICNLLLK